MTNSTPLIWRILKIIFSIFMIFAGAQHFINANFYLSFVPSFLPYKMLIIYASGIIEIGLGTLLFSKKYSGKAAYGLFILMLIFLPIHINDVFSDNPAIGSHRAALIRLPIQLVLIALAWKLKILLYKIRSIDEKE